MATTQAQGEKLARYLTNRVEAWAVRNREDLAANIRWESGVLVGRVTSATGTVPSQLAAIVQGWGRRVGHEVAATTEGAALLLGGGAAVLFADDFATDRLALDYFTDPGPAGAITVEAGIGPGESSGLRVVSGEDDLDYAEGSCLAPTLPATSGIVSFRAEIKPIAFSAGAVTVLRLVNPNPLLYVVELVRNPDWPGWNLAFFPGASGIEMLASDYFPLADIPVGAWTTVEIVWYRDTAPRKVECYVGGALKVTIEDDSGNPLLAARTPATGGFAAMCNGSGETEIVLDNLSVADGYQGV